MKYIKKLLRKGIGKFNGTFGWKINRTGNAHNFFHNLLDDYFLVNKTVTFIQIGGCDGESYDPIFPYLKRHKKRVKGVIVEPLDEYCNELRNLYADQPEIKIHQAALHNSKKRMDFYRPDNNKSDTMPDFIKGTPSFNKQHITKYGIPESDIIRLTVDCISLPELVGRYGLEDADILQIDTEGYDSQIILNIDFDTFKPAMIHFEHGLRDKIMSPEDLADIVKLLNFNDYDIHIDDFDATAYIRDLY
jgi:FkbM family methyltransferase